MVMKYTVIIPTTQNWSKIKTVPPEEFYRIRHERLKSYRLDEDPLALPLSVKLGTDVMVSHEVRKIFIAQTVRNVKPSVRPHKNRNPYA